LLRCALIRSFKPTLALWTTLASISVAALGSLRIFEPFSGDQALFLVAAERLHAGGVLYRDFWDIKQPGIFFFFESSGSLFGFTQVGLHLADGIWQVLFAFALIRSLHLHLEDRRWAAFAPIAVVGAYLAGSSPWHLLQVEELAGLPLLCVPWLALEALANARRRRALVALSGSAAGVAILLKSLFALVALALALTVYLTGRRCLDRRDRQILPIFWLGGLLLPLMVFTCYIFAFGIADRVLMTFFAMPWYVASTVPHAPYGRLVDSSMRFVLYFRGIIFLAVFGAFFTHDEGSRRWRLIALVWLGAAMLTIFVQQQSWWQYHFTLLLPPVGILATYGAAGLARRVRATGRWGIAWLALCGLAAYIAVPLPQLAVSYAMRIGAEQPYRSPRALERYRAASDPEYADAGRDAAFIAREPRGSGGIFVLGDPLIYLLTGERQAIAVNGWAPDLYPPPVWNLLVAELRERPPASVFVLDHFAAELPHQSPATVDFLRTRYVRQHRTRDGVWLRLRPRPALRAERPGGSSTSRRGARRTVVEEENVARVRGDLTARAAERRIVRGAFLRADHERARVRADRAVRIGAGRLGSGVERRERVDVRPRVEEQRVTARDALDADGVRRPAFAVDHGGEFRHGFEAFRVRLADICNE